VILINVLLNTELTLFSQAPLLSSSWVAMTATQANIICLPITDPIGKLSEHNPFTSTNSKVEGTGWCKDLPTPALCLLTTQDPDVTECRCEY
jgi:hypothetical protein